MRRTGSILAALLLAGGMLAERQPQQIELQAAIRQETVDGDLQGAIKRYAAIVAKYAKADRAVAATALVHMAECYQKMGDAESRKIYEQVVKDYADQKDAATLARTRLGTVTVHGAGIVTRQVWSGPNVTDVGPVSADGRYLTFTDWGTGNIFLRDLSTGNDKDLTHKGTYTESSEEGDGSVISPDAKQVAYSWLSKDLRYQLRVVRVGGNAPAASRVLYDNEEIDWIGPSAWSPDGQWIAVQIQRKDRTAQIGLVNAADGNLRILKSVDWRLATSIFFSPDGKYLAYDLPASDHSEQRDVFIIAADGSREIPAVVHPAYDAAMGWTPAGDYVLFASDRSGTMAIWALPFRDGKPDGTPALIKSDIGQPWPLGMTRSGAFYFGVRPHGFDLYVAAIDPHSGAVLSPPVRAVDSFVGANRNPDWSPDGKYLVYQTRRDPGGRFDILAIRAVDSGEVRELRPKLGWFFWPRWAPDGRSVVVQGADAKGRQGVYRIETQSGDVAPIAISQPGEYHIFPQWAPGGNKIYFRRENQARREYAVVELDVTAGSERELMHAKVEPWPLSISPDGRHIAYTTYDYVSKQPTLMLLPVADGDPRELLRLPKPQEFGWVLAWTPDSRSIMFRKNLTPTFNDGGELWLASLDGAPPRKVNFNIENVENVRFDPKTGKVVFTGGRVSGEVWVMENFLSTLSAKR